MFQDGSLSLSDSSRTITPSSSSSSTNSSDKESSSDSDNSTVSQVYSSGSENELATKRDAEFYISSRTNFTAKIRKVDNSIGITPSSSIAVVDTLMSDAKDVPLELSPSVVDENKIIKDKFTQHSSSNLLGLAPDYTADQDDVVEINSVVKTSPLKLLHHVLH